MKRDPKKADDLDKYREALKEEKPKDKVDLGVKLLEVHNKTKRAIISSDVVLARFNGEKDKQYIIEMDQAAFYYLQSEMKKLQIQIESRLLFGIPIPKEEILATTTLIDGTYQLMMNSIGTLSIVNRNVDNNYLASLIMESQQAPPEMVDVDPNSALLKKVGDKFRNEQIQEAPPLR